VLNATSTVATVSFVGTADETEVPFTSLRKRIDGGAATLATRGAVFDAPAKIKGSIIVTSAAAASASSSVFSSLASVPESPQVGSSTLA
jgi:hypothetical protein